MKERKADNGKRKTDPKMIGRQEVTMEAGKRPSGTNKVQAAAVTSGEAMAKKPTLLGTRSVGEASKTEEQ